MTDIDYNLPTSTAEESANTIAVYDRIAADYVERTLGVDMGALYNALSMRVAMGANVLDVGAGSGRDALALAARGYQVDLLEPSSALLEHFHMRHPGYPGRTYHGTALQVALPERHYHAIVASASLLHVPLAQWPATLANLRSASCDGAWLFVSVKQQVSGYDGEGRWFTGFDSIETLRQQVETGGLWRFDQGAIGTDSLGRPTPWLEAWFRTT